METDKELCERLENLALKASITVYVNVGDMFRLLDIARRKENSDEQQSRTPTD